MAANITRLQLSQSLPAHPEYQIELEHLRLALGIIDKYLEKNNPYSVDPDKYWEVYGGADEHTAQVFRQSAITTWENLQSTQREPYFGKFIFSPFGSEEETFYISKTGFSRIAQNTGFPGMAGAMVVDWRAPIAQLFYRSNGLIDQSYTAPGGAIRGKLLLKRHLKIQDRLLTAIVDELDYRNGVHVSPQASKSISQELLIEELNDRGDPHLQDIIKTIQEHQDKLIRYPVNTTLLINGVAGSGKTSVAYHRIAYILFPDNNLGISPQKTIVFSPNRLFLSYVKTLLPSLQIKGVHETTFDDWALMKMGYATVENGQIIRKIKVQESAISVFLDPNSDRTLRRDTWQRARLKGSLKMKNLLDKFVEYFPSSVDLPKEGWRFEGLGKLNLTIILSNQDIQEAYQSAFSQKLPYDRQRQWMISLLSKLIEQRYSQAVEDECKRLRDEGQIEAAHTFLNRANRIPLNKSEVIQAATIRLKEKMNETWKRLMREDYYQLIRNYKLLKTLGEGIFTETEIALIMQSHYDTRIIDIEDFPALLYFFMLIHGKGEESYDHIVIDEAQDFSPLQYYILNQYSRNQSMTIVGDISQGIYAHRGINDWSELNQVFTSQAIHHETMDLNYRATTEIVEFTNHVNRMIRRDKVNPVSGVHRSGKKPRIVQARSKANMFDAIFADILDLQKKKIKNIGVITKSPGEAKEVFQFLRTSKEHVLLITDRDEAYDYKGGVVILPITLSKGLEFEAVLLVGADAINFEKSVEYDGRLLYVGLTRALHELYIYFFGQLSPYLNDARQKAQMDVL